MIGQWFGKNLILLPLEEAVVPLDDINFTYGYGVYETLKVRHGKVYFCDLHVQRLMNSAAIIGLDHDFNPKDIESHIFDIADKNRHEDANLKVLLIGGEHGTADLYVLELNPLFPKRVDYKHGAHAISFSGERQYPQAKSLNMLVSTMAYRKAREEGAYDALLVNRNHHILEGTRTNLLFTDGQRIFTAPESMVLSGVTMITVRKVLQNAGVEIVEDLFTLDQIREFGFRSAFLTSTSTKIMPLRSIDQIPLQVLPIIHEWMHLYDAWLETYRLGTGRMFIE